MLHSWMRRGVTWTMMAGAMHALKMVVSWGHSPTESVTSEKVVPAQESIIFMIVSQNLHLGRMCSLE